MATVPGIDLIDAAVKWLRLVSLHRERAGSFGRVVVAVGDTADGSELRMTEETTFRASDECPDPLAVAQGWVATQSDRRREHGLSGTIHVEAVNKNGRVTSAKVIEVTVLEKSSPGKSTAPAARKTVSGSPTC